MLPEFPSEFVENYPVEERAVQHFRPLAYLTENADLWEEIRTVLSAREFEAFQLHYRFQMPYYDIERIMQIKFQSVYKLLGKAEAKLRAHFLRSEHE